MSPATESESESETGVVPAKERRRNPRVTVPWPAVVQAMTGAPKKKSAVTMPIRMSWAMAALRLMVGMRCGFLDSEPLKNLLIAIGMPLPGPARITSITISGMNEDEFANRLLQEEHVAVVPGTAFGAGGEGYVRFALIENEQRIAFFGYKAHVGVDEGSGLIRAVLTTPANVNDTTPADDLIRGDEAVVWADAAYDTHARRARLKAEGKKPRIARRPNRHHPELPARLKRYNRLIARRRAKVETTFATLKCRMRLTRIRYVGLETLKAAAARDPLRRPAVVERLTGLATDPDVGPVAAAELAVLETYLPQRLDAAAVIGRRRVIIAPSGMSAVPTWVPTGR